MIGKKKKTKDVTYMVISVGTGFAGNSMFPNPLPNLHF
jgi:hypothetical protein